MATYIALLRGVNVGKAQRLPMAAWRTLLGDLGYTQVVTLLNSGNAVFEAARGSATQQAQAIAAAVAGQLGLVVPVLVLPAKTWTAIVQANPLTLVAADPSRLLVAFAQDRAALQSLAAVAPLVGPTEQWVLGDHAGYLYCPDGILQSRAGTALLGRLGASVTTRNWATVQKLQALLARR